MVLIKSMLEGRSHCVSFQERDSANQVVSCFFPSDQYQLQINGHPQDPYLYYQEDYLSQPAQRNCIRFPVPQHMGRIRVPGLAVLRTATAR
jgi:hypothetical protein